MKDLNKHNKSKDITLLLDVIVKIGDLELI